MSISYEINVGLFDAGHADDGLWSAVHDRYSYLESLIGPKAGVDIRFHPGEEPTAVIRGKADDYGKLYMACYMISVKLKQDCVALYLPSPGTGHLIGPRADQWGNFDLDYFERF